MSKGDWWSVAITLIVTGAGYFIGGQKAAWACLIIGAVLVVVLRFTRGDNEIPGPRLHLAFDTMNDMALCVQNNGGGEAHGIELRIPRDGSWYTSTQINILRETHIARLNSSALGVLTPYAIIKEGGIGLQAVLTYSDGQRQFERIFEPDQTRDCREMKLIDAYPLGILRRLGQRFVC